MKSIKLFIFGLFGLFANLLKGITPDFMDRNTKDTLKKYAFDSLDEETYDDEQGYDDSYDEFKGKKRTSTKAGGGSMRGSGWVPTTGYFTINIVNAIGANQQVELFNSLSSWASVANAVLSTFNPFTFTNRAAANANSTIVYAPNGDLVVTTGAGAILTISCPDIPYKTLVETLKFYRIAVKSLKLGFTNLPQLNNPIIYTETTFMGKANTNRFLPKASFLDNQFQGKQVTIEQKFLLDGERGLNFLCNSGETMDLTFNLEGYKKN